MNMQSENAHIVSSLISLVRFLRMGVRPIKTRLNSDAFMKVVMLRFVPLIRAHIK
jgi:hypothetical protein